MQAISFAPTFELIRTAALLAIALFFYGDQRHRLARLSRWESDFYNAVFFLIFTIASMEIVSVPAAGTPVNFRSVAVLLATVFAGPFPGLVAAAAGLLVRSASDAVNTPLGVAVLFIIFALGWAYHYWVQHRGRRLGYVDFVILGVIFDLGRVAAWLALFGYRGVIDAIDRDWIEVLVVFPIAVLMLGATALVADERRALTRTVADNEARLRGILDQLPASVSLVDSEDRYTFVNRAQAEWVGIPAAEQIGTLRQTTWDKVGAGGSPHEHFKRALATGEMTRTELRKVSVRGQPSWRMGTYFPVRDTSGVIKEVGTVSIDLTELWTTREKLAQRDEMLERLNKALTAIVSESEIGSQPLDAVIRKVTEAAGAALQVRRTGVFRFDLDADDVERLDLWDGEARAHLPIAFTSRPIAWQSTGLMDRDEVITVEDASNDPRVVSLREHMQANDIGAMMMAPIYVAGRFRGLVTFAHVGGARSWTIEETSFARSIADVVAVIYLDDRYREALAALDLIEDGIYVEEASGRIIYGNRAAFAMARGKPVPVASQLMLKTLPAIFPRPSRALQAEFDRCETTIDFEGGQCDIQIERRRLPNGGIITLVRDLTRRNRAQRERERLENQLVQASKLEAIGQLAGGIAHDFNNLLGAMLGFARFIEEDLPPESKEHHYASRIIAACERGKAVVTQINSFARARNIDRAPIDLAPLLKDSRDLLVGLVRSTTALSINMPEGVLPALANRGQITQLLVNLVANANDALDAQSGEIAIVVSRLGHGETAADEEDRQLSLFDDKYRRRRMLGQIDPARDYVRIDVSDTGKGIPPRIVPHIFEPFFTSKRRTGGTGLGLAVVHSIVTTHEGVLYLDSVEGKGTTFSIYLPLIAALDAEQFTQTVTSKNEGSERVLIVDDDVDVADMLSIGLARVGYEVAVTNDPLEALEAFTEEPGGWDVAVIDRMMPEMGGIELAQRLKAIRADLRVILCTGLDDGTIDSSRSDQGFDLFLIKPITPDRIAGGIRRLVE